MPNTAWESIQKKLSPTSTKQTPAMPYDYGLPKPKYSAFAGPQSALLHDSSGTTLKNAVDLNVTNTTPWYKDGNAMQGYAGLAGTLMQAAQLPEQMRYAKLQRKGLEQNLAQAKADSALQATARSNLNAPVYNTGG
tara:strand:+ start:11340 stop:11747 length:408 start_codon:yes stop_codon:yes gene_type:complete